MRKEEFVEIPKKIIIPVYWAYSKKGKIKIDAEGMQDEFDMVVGDLESGIWKGKKIKNISKVI